MNFDGLTCILPTHNRSQFLRRQVDYINHCGSFPHVIVVDSSIDEHACENQSVCNGNPLVEYTHSDQPYFEKVLAVLDRISTPFVIFCADDDTLSPAGVSDCLARIRDDASLYGVIGRCYIANTGAPALSIARGYALKYPDPIARLKYYSNNWFSNFYAIHRRELLGDQLRFAMEAVDAKRSRLLNELLTSMLAIVPGPLEYIDCDYLCYQIHTDNLSKTTPAVRDPAEIDHLTTVVEEALVSYAQKMGITSLGERQHEVRNILARYMARQRLPGRSRSWRSKLQRESQRLARRIIGHRHNTGFLETIPIDNAPTMRCPFLNFGVQQTIRYPSGLRAA